MNPLYQDLILSEFDRLTPKVLTIHDLSVFGRCSLTVAIPILSSFGIQVCPLPTAILSSHTQIPGFCLHDINQRFFEDCFQHWEKINVQFNGFYSGYLAHVDQVDFLVQFLDHQNQKGKQFSRCLIDPVMADEGKLYSGFDQEFVQKMQKLAHYAQCLTPNVSELALLLDQPFQAHYTLEELQKAIRQMHKRYHIPYLVVKGIRFYDNPNQLHCVLSFQEGQIFIISTQWIEKNFHGAGDVFASVIMSQWMQYSIKESFHRAFCWISDLIDFTDNTDYPYHQQGLPFEYFLNKQQPFRLQAYPMKELDQHDFN